MSDDASKLKLTFVRDRWATGRVGTGATIFAEHPRCHHEYTRNGIERKHVCGLMYLDESDDVVKVGGIKVDYYARRSGLGFRVGTRLYETAAKVSCKLAGKPFTSDFIRSTLAEEFWQKQLKKGRASYDAENDRYVIACPAPASLAGARRR